VQYLLLSATFLSCIDSQLKAASECGTLGSCVHAVSMLLHIITVFLVKYKFTLFKYSTVCVCARARVRACVCVCGRTRAWELLNGF